MSTRTMYSLIVLWSLVAVGVAAAATYLINL
jgi:hypothetical protein